MSDVESTQLYKACEDCIADFGLEDDKELLKRLYGHIQAKFSDQGKSWSHTTIYHVLEKWLKVK